MRGDRHPGRTTDQLAQVERIPGDHDRDAAGLAAALDGALALRIGARA